MTLLTVLILALLQAGSGTPGAAFLQYNNAIATEEWQTALDLIAEDACEYLYTIFHVDQYNNTEVDEESAQRWEALTGNTFLGYRTWKITAEPNWKQKYASREIISEEVDGDQAIITYRDYLDTGTEYLVKEDGKWMLNLAYLERTLIQLEEQRAAALVKQDKAALAALLHPDYVEINMFGMFSGRELLDEFLDRHRLVEYSIYDEQFHQLGTEACALDYHANIYLRANDKTTVYQCLVNATYKKTPKGWLLAILQITPLSEYTSSR